MLASCITKVCKSFVGTRTRTKTEAILFGKVSSLPISCHPSPPSLQVSSVTSDTQNMFSSSHSNRFLSLIVRRKCFSKMESHSRKFRKCIHSLSFLAWSQIWLPLLLLQHFHSANNIFLTSPHFISAIPLGMREDFS